MKELQTLSSMSITQESEHTLNDITWNFPKRGLKIKKTQKANHPKAFGRNGALLPTPRSILHAPRSWPLWAMPPRFSWPLGLRWGAMGGTPAKSQRTRVSVFPPPSPLSWVVTAALNCLSPKRFIIPLATLTLSIPLQITSSLNTLQLNL